MARKFLVTYLVNDKDLPILLTTISTNLLATIGTNVTLQSVKVIEDESSSSKKMHYTGGKRNKGVSGVDLALNILGSNGVTSTETFKKAFVEAGFSENSYSPVLYKLINEGRVRRMNGGNYELT